MTKIEWREGDEIVIDMGDFEWIATVSDKGWMPMKVRSKEVAE